ncbi:membrane integrity-associated transporter subunit PqiC [Variovorax sp. M-6]|uniref:PqiC family protein n=1 Tax=Variovorax sp. M-6 TaxID=3233041 RepID=UPI003F973092
MNAPIRWAAWPLGAALAATLVACASTPAPVLLTLPPAVSAPVAASAPATVRVLAVGRPEIPEYLVARRVRYRAEASTLGEWPDTFWAERIEIGVAREFSAALGERLPGWRLCEASCSEQSPALSLQVVLSRMDYVRSEQRLKATARISLWSTDRAPRLLHGGEFSYDIPGDADSAPSQARALTELLRRVAAQAATSVAAVP